MKNNYSQNIYLAILLTLLFIPLGVWSQNIADTIKSIEEVFSEFNQNTPGVAIRISRGNEVVYSNGFGMADLEHNVPITDETVFEAGSVSKQFTATAILMLVQDGKINLEDDIHTYIPEMPQYNHKITIRHLLNHTSGLRDWGVVAEIGGWPRGTRIYTNEAALAYILKQEELNNIPNDEYIYSNSNYTLLTIIVERVSGMKLPEFTQKRMFDPLGMKDTKWRTNFKNIVVGRAVGYDKNNEGFLSNMPFENTYGHAALLTTVKDLDIWNQSWKNSPLGNEDLLKLRTEQGVLNNGTKIFYAAGVMIDSHNGHYEVNHSGSTAGYKTWLSFFPESSLSIACLSNASYFLHSKVGEELATIFFDKDSLQLSETPLEKTNDGEDYLPQRNDLKALIGSYYSSECGGEYTLVFENDSLWIYDHAQKKKLMQPVSKNNFKAEENMEFTFKSFGTNQLMYISMPRVRNIRFERK